MEKLILITNDDGVHSEGIRILQKELGNLGRAVIVAPHAETSSTGHSITLHSPLRLEKIDDDIYSFTGFPADCVYIGLHEILKKRPDIVVSGINKGANLGIDVYYSGTAAAAREAAFRNIKSVAVSLVDDFNRDSYNWSSCASYTLDFVKKYLDINNNFRGYININYPNVCDTELKGSKITVMGKRNYAEGVIWRTDPRGKKYCWVGGSYNGFEKIQDSDCVALSEKYISITPMFFDTSDLEMKKEMETWDI